MKLLTFLSQSFFMVVGSVLLAAGPIAAAERPNIIYILCDDLGYGDVRCLNPQGKIATPQMDRLAAEGMVFTDAHSSSSVCSPTRYSLMTGRYNWRSRLQSGVLGGMSSPLIERGRLTVAELLRENGYRTACIGKWHLGLEWSWKENTRPPTAEAEFTDPGVNVDYTQPIGRGPTTLGFDYYFGISGSLDMPPYTFIENDRVTVLPTVQKDFPLFSGKPRGTRRGAAAEVFEAADVQPTLTSRAVDYIKRNAAEAKSGRPFFLYLPYTSPHTPILPKAQWAGKSGLNAYGDFVMQTDDGIGAVLRALDESGLAESTLVVVTSDNGCSLQADFPALLAKGHNPSSVFRGQKTDIFDGGHRIPHLVRWPGKVRAGSTSNQLVCLVDLMATVADIVGAKYPVSAGEDSISFLPALLGRTDGATRADIVHHSSNGSFSIREGNWKLELCADSGGVGAPRPGSKAAADLPAVQLYDLSTDVSEQHNVMAKHPEIVARLTAVLEKYVANGRSTPGAKQANAVPIAIRKSVAAAKTKEEI